MNLFVDMYGQKQGDRNYGKGVYFAPLSFIPAGYYSYVNGNRSYRASVGYFWQSRISSYMDYSTAFTFLFSTSDLNFGYSGSKGYGYSVRCVSK